MVRKLLLSIKEKKLKEQRVRAYWKDDEREENLSRMIPEQVPRSAHQH
jgi:hypothetical protein